MLVDIIRAANTWRVFRTDIGRFLPERYRTQEQAIVAARRYEQRLFAR